jgi:hypothetical protein
MLYFESVIREVIPAKAGIQDVDYSIRRYWMPAGA